MNTLAQKPMIKRRPLNVVSTKNSAILPVKQNASIVKKVVAYCFEFITHFCFYFPVSFFWLMVAFVLIVDFSMTYLFEPEVMFLTLDKVDYLLAPVFRL